MSADSNCTRSLCGCWRPSHLSFSTRVIDGDGNPVEGVALTCHGETEPIAHSNLVGSVTFEIDTMESPGCHFRRCSNLNFSDPHARFVDQQTTEHVANGASVTLRRRH
jgi:hypothetical protein